MASKIDKDIFDTKLAFELETFGNIFDNQTFVNIDPNIGTMGWEPDKVLFDEAPLAYMKPVDDTKNQALGDDRSPRYNWTPEQLQKADPTHPDIDLDLPFYVAAFLSEREKLAGREPIPEGDNDVESI